MPFPQPVPNPDQNKPRQQPLPKVHVEVDEPARAKMPALSREFQRFDLLDALRKALPDLGKGIARAHYLLNVSSQYNESRYEDAKQKIKELTRNPDAVTSHEPLWHEYGIVTHTENVIDVALRKWPQLRDPRGDLRWAITELASRKIGELSQLQLLIFSLPLHDIGKFQPIIKSSNETGIGRIYHTGHEKRGGDIVAAARSDNPPEELQELSRIFKTFAITPGHLDYIEQCVRLHYEFGKVRDQAKKTATGYTVAYTQTPDFERACKAVAEGHPHANRHSDMSLEKGVLFLFDSAGKTNFLLQNEGDGATWAQHVQETGAEPKLLNAYRQYHVNIEVGLRYLAMLREQANA